MKSPIVTADISTNTLTLQIPATATTPDLYKLLTRPANLEVRRVPQLDSKWLTRPLIVNGTNTGTIEILGANGRSLSPSAKAALWSEPAPFSSADFKPNFRVEQPLSEVAIHFELKESSKARFKQFSKRLIRKRMAIFLDHQLLMAPTIMDPIPGQGVITLVMPLEDAKSLAIQLNSGPLPFPLIIVKRPPDL